MAVDVSSLNQICNHICDILSQNRSLPPGWSVTLDKNPKMRITEVRSPHFRFSFDGKYHTKGSRGTVTDIEIDPLNIGLWLAGSPIGATKADGRTKLASDGNNDVRDLARFYAIAAEAYRWLKDKELPK